MAALEELPDSNKDELLPLIMIRPWLGAHYLESAISKINEVHGARPWIADIDPQFFSSANRRPVHDEIDELLDPEGGFNAWCEFVDRTDGMGNAIPCVQIDADEIDEVISEIDNLAEIGRGVVVRIRARQLVGFERILERIADHEEPDAVFLLDYGQNNIGLLDNVAGALGLIDTINQALPQTAVAISATTFPNSFNDLEEQEIFERQFFNETSRARPNTHLIYSDWGSAREERQQGGSGAPYPRVDYPLNDNWRFHRVQTDVRPDGYYEAARIVTRQPYWDANLRIWGTQMIERAAAEDEFSIISPVRATAVRINIHLHRQLHYGAPPDELYDTEDDWVD